MSEFPLSVYLGDASRRLAALIDEAIAYQGDQPVDVIRRLLQELATGFEELRVSEEELFVQAEQLVASHQAIDAERERYGKLFEFAPDGYVETDEHGKVLEANSAAARLLGVPVRLLIGKLIVSFAADADRRRLRRMITDAIKGEGDHETQVVLQTRDGEPFRAGIRVGVDADVRRGLVSVRWLIRDITERLRLEAERELLQEEVDLLLTMSELTRLTNATDDPLSPVLDGVVEVTKGLIDGSVSITLLDRRSGLTTGSASDEIARSLSDFQHVQGGPCEAAARQGTRYEADIDNVPLVWRPLADLLSDQGFISILAIPLLVADQPVGAVNVYLRHGLSEAPRRALALLGEQAASAIANAQLFRSASELTSQLTSALDSRAVIERAKGVIMALERCDENKAFDLLRRSSQRTNRKLRDVAAELIETNSAPRLPPPGLRPNL